MKRPQTCWVAGSTGGKDANVITSNGTGDHARKETTQAVQHVLANDPEARRFDLHELPERVELQSYGWSIPVTSGAMSGSAYDLARAIEHAQELAERQIQQELSVFLSLFD